MPTKPRRFHGSAQRHRVGNWPGLTAATVKFAKTLRILTLDSSHLAWCNEKTPLDSSYLRIFLFCISLGSASLGSSITCSQDLLHLQLCPCFPPSFWQYPISGLAADVESCHVGPYERIKVVERLLLFMMVILHLLELWQIMIGFTVPHYCNCPGGCEWARLDQINEMLHMKSSIHCNHSKNASYTYAKGSWVARFCMVFLPSPVDASAIEIRERSLFWFVRKIRPAHLANKPHRKTLLLRNLSPGMFLYMLYSTLHFTHARSVFCTVLSWQHLVTVVAELRPVPPKSSEGPSFFLSLMS